MLSDFTYHTLSCGLRCVHSHAPGLAEVCGLTVDAGSRDEKRPEDYGLAHFVEHTIFKGTRRRRAWHILNRMEAVGGELNAYTTKESTTIYTVAPRGHCARSLELLSDLVTDSVFPAPEIEREREVVLDEIDSYLDSPADAVYDEIDELAFRGNPLAHNILGTDKSVKAFTGADCRRWLDEHYRPGHMVLFYSGHLPAQRFFASAERLFAPLATRHSDTPLQRTVPGMINLPVFESRRRDSHQSHTIVAARTGSMFSDDRYALSLLTNILGGPGMNSLLNVELRERRGLVYTVEASTTLYTDCGLFTIYLGCDHDDTRRCLSITRRLLTQMAEKPLSQRRLDAARRQYLGQLALAAENHENAAMSMGRATLYRGTVPPASETEQRLNEVTTGDLQRVAELLLPDRLIELNIF